VLDTSVLVAAVRSNVGASKRLVEAALLQRYTLLATTNLFFRIRSNSYETKYLAASGLSVDQMDDLLDALAAAVVEVYPSYLWRAQLRDPDDDLVLEAAINGRGDAMVTFNGRDFGVVPERFNLRVLRPGDALAGLEK
jgi:predicted nucleic acid-binding protein